MKWLVFGIVAVVFFNCGQVTTESEVESIAKDSSVIQELVEEMDTTEKITENKDCKAKDFLQLKEKELQRAFFDTLENTLEVQYPDGDREEAVFVNLTPKLLKEFLEDIDIAAFSKNNTFEQEYHFNIAPKEYSDPAVCKDKISVTFKNCRFIVNIYNTFLVEENWCTESMVVYAFSIENGQIIDFWRNAAG